MTTNSMQVLLLAALLGCLARLASASSGGAEISPSVMLIGKFDWEMERLSNGQVWSRCLDQLWRAAERAESTQASCFFFWGGRVSRGQQSRNCLLTATYACLSQVPW